MIRLGLNYLSFCLSSIYNIDKISMDFDLVFVYQLSPVLMGVSAVFYAKKNNLPLFLYCCDLWPESIKTYLKSERNPIFYFAKKISGKLQVEIEQKYNQETLSIV